MTTNFVRKFFLIYIFCILCTFFLIMILSSSSSFFYQTTTKSGVITLGQASIVSVNLNPYFNELVNCGDIIEKEVTVVNARDASGLNISRLSNLLIRVKCIYLLDSEETNLIEEQLATPEDWTTDCEDGYIYYNKILNKGEFLTIFDEFVVSQNIPEFTNPEIQVEIIIEAMQSEGNLSSSFWPTSPENWQNLIK